MQAHIFIHGFVQGVGFRRFVRGKAIFFGLKGWVKNTSDGRVEAVFQGDKSKIEELIKICEKGSFFAEVKSLQLDWEREKDNFKDFRILT